MCVCVHNEVHMCASRVCEPYVCPLIDLSHVCVHLSQFFFDILACQGVLVRVLGFSDIVQLSKMLPILIKHPSVPTVSVTTHSLSFFHVN